ncbi:MAG: putative signal transducing protein [Candidatus Promineifilaceae bacterium]|jgi:Putative prokaryotic signal transducing protein
MSESPSIPVPNGGLDSGETTPGGRKEVRWVEVAQTPGLTPAQIMAGRLQAEGVPAYAWQEGAGQATGLIVGMLGAGHVMVPEDFEDEALRILSEDATTDEPD